MRARCFKHSLTHSLAGSSRLRAVQELRHSASHCASFLSVSHRFSRKGGRERGVWGGIVGEVLDHSRRGGKDRAPRTHLKDALPRATARPVEIQQARRIEASAVLFLSMFGFVQENLSLFDTPWAHNITLQTGEEEGGVSCFSSCNIQSKSVWFLLNMLLIIAITAAPRVLCVPPEASCTVTMHRCAGLYHTASMMYWNKCAVGT